MCAAEEKETKGKLLMEENFKPGWEKNWVFEGKVKTSVDKDGFLHIKNSGPNVLWYKKPFKGDIELQFDAYVKDRKGKPILFFLAHPINNQPFFDDKRTSFYGEYAWNRIMGLYSIGFMRDLRKDDDKSNFRYLGGNIKDDWRNLSFHAGTPDFKKHWNSQEQYKKSWKEYEIKSKPSASPDGCAEVNKKYRITARKISDRIQFLVDEKIIHDVQHTDKDTGIFFAPPEEGYIGIRNFVKNTDVWVGNIKVWELND